MTYQLKSNSVRFRLHQSLSHILLMGLEAARFHVVHWSATPIQQFPCRQSTLLVKIKNTHPQEYEQIIGHFHTQSHMIYAIYKCAKGSGIN